MAWLTTAPDDSTLTRFGRATDQQSIEMVQLGDFQYIAELFQDLGFAQQTREGLTPISFTEIQAWNCLINADVTPWEVSALRSMSVSYCAEVRRSSGKDTESPTFIKQGE